MKRPITIIGGGLSGLALGCYLRKHQVKVTIIEQREYPRHKVCGEFICGVRDEILEELGISPLFEQAISVKKISWYIAEKKVLDKKLPLAGRGISRYFLDDALQNLFTDLGGEILQKRIDKSSYLESQREGVVWACGKENRGKGKDALRWLGMKVHLKGMNISELEMHTGVRSKHGGYVGLAPVENGMVNLCGLFEVNKEIPGKGAEKIHGYLMAMGLEKLATRIQSTTMDSDSFSAVAGFSMGTQTILGNMQEGVFQIGDAAILIPPFTGNGMSMALESALLAGKNLLPYCRAEYDISWDKVQKTYLHQLRKTFQRRLTVAKCIHPFFFHHRGKIILAALARLNLIPFRSLFYLLR